MAVAGMSWMELVLMARYVHMALVAVPGRGLSVSRCRMAFKPSGVAALPRPRMLAAMLSSIAPIAGWSWGTSGKSQTIRGRSRRASAATSPARSASRMMPSQSAMMPTSGSAVRITANSAISKLLSAIAFRLSVQPPMITASTTSPSQM